MANWILGRAAEQRRAHDGSTLADLAAIARDQLPRAPLRLVSFSVEGCALAAVIASQRSSSSWEQATWDLVLDDRPLAVIEPVRLGDGVLEAIGQRWPDAIVIHGLASTPDLTVAA